jgi:hypothetical protein
MFYRILVRSNEDTVSFYRRGTTFLSVVEQMFEIRSYNRYRRLRLKTISDTTPSEPEAQDERCNHR